MKVKTYKKLLEFKDGTVCPTLSVRIKILKVRGLLHASSEDLHVVICVMPRVLVLIACVIMFPGDIEEFGRGSPDVLGHRVGTYY